MKLKIILVINAIVVAIFGIALVLIPAQLLSLYGITVDTSLKYMAQLFGAALIGFAVLTWSARNSSDSGARRAIILALFVTAAIGCIVAVLGALAGFMNPLSWSTVAIYLFFAAVFGYFQFARPTTST